MLQKHRGYRNETVHEQDGNKLKTDSLSVFCRPQPLTEIAFKTKFQVLLLKNLPELEYLGTQHSNLGFNPCWHSPSAALVQRHRSKQTILWVPWLAWSWLQSAGTEAAVADHVYRRRREGGQWHGSGNAVLSVEIGAAETPLVKSTGCFCTGLRFGAKHPPGCSQLPGTPVPGRNPTPSYGLRRNCIDMHAMYVSVYIHKI